ncbi:MAG: hypothetical protein PXX73_01445 [Sideroxydans sp.]|nr:hypothetical protein [Sideroxydans sp.]
MKHTFCLFAVLSLASMNSACAGPAAATGKAVAPLSQSYTWYDGNRAQTVWLNPQLLAEFNPTPQSATQVRAAGLTTGSVKEVRGGVRLWQVSNSTTAARALTSAQPNSRFAPVLHSAPNASAAMKSLPGNVVVIFNPAWDGAAVQAWLTRNNLQMVEKVGSGSNVYLIKSPPGLASLDLANAIYKAGEVLSASPNWWTEVHTR